MCPSIPHHQAPHRSGTSPFPSNLRAVCLPMSQLATITDLFPCRDSVLKASYGLSFHPHSDAKSSGLSALPFHRWGKLRLGGVISCSDLSRQVVEPVEDLGHLTAARVVFAPVLNSHKSGSCAVGSWGIICQLALVPTSFPCPAATRPIPECPSHLSHTLSLSPSCQRKGRSLAESGGHRAPSPVQDPSLWL